MLATIEGGRDDEGDLEKESVPVPLSKAEGLIVFFHGSAKSALCKELLKALAEFGGDRLVQSVMGDLVKEDIDRRSLMSAGNSYERFYLAMQSILILFRFPLSVLLG